jgi:hypothetical protein
VRIYIIDKDVSAQGDGRTGALRRSLKLAESVIPRRAQHDHPGTVRDLSMHNRTPLTGDYQIPFESECFAEPVDRGRSVSVSKRWDYRWMRRPGLLIHSNRSVETINLKSGAGPALLLAGHHVDKAVNV